MKNNRRRIGVLTALVGGVMSLGSLVVGPGSVSASGSQQVELNNSTANTGKDCPNNVDDYWHFVIAPNNGSYSITSITLKIGSSTTTFSGGGIIKNGGQSDNVFVKVPAGKSLSDLKASNSYATVTGSSNKDPKFNLSHLCDGTGTPPSSSSSSSTSTTVKATTTTEKDDKCEDSDYKSSSNRHDECCDEDGYKTSSDHHDECDDEETTTTASTAPPSTEETTTTASTAPPNTEETSTTKPSTPPNTEETSTTKPTVPPSSTPTTASTTSSAPSVSQLPPVVPSTDDEAGDGSNSSVAAGGPLPPATGGGSGSLPRTGSDQQMILLLGGLTLVSAGALMIALTRRPTEA